MKKVTRTNRHILDISGTITGPNGLRVEVSFDLIELEDLNDGKPGHKCSYGVLRFQKPLEPSVEPRLLSTTPLILTGGGIQATLCLYKLNSFTVVDSVREFSDAAEFVGA